MKTPDFVFAILPPILAILLQIFPVPTDKYLAAKATERQQRAKLPTQAASMILETSRGALAVASFGPTVVSFLISAYALIYDRPDLPEYGLILLLIAILIVVMAASRLSRYGPYELSTSLITAPFGIHGFLPWTWADVINYTIYGVNALLIALAMAKRFNYLPVMHWLHG